jgi:hypothetical protein
MAIICRGTTNASRDCIYRKREGGEHVGPNKDTFAQTWRGRRASRHSCRGRNRGVLAGDVRQSIAVVETIEDDVIVDCVGCRVGGGMIGYHWCQAPNFRLILLCARKIVKRTLSVNACQWRRNCCPHVGLNKGRRPVSEIEKWEQGRKRATHVHSGSSLCIGTYTSCLGSVELTMGSSPTTWEVS